MIQKLVKDAKRKSLLAVVIRFKCHRIIRCGVKDSGFVASALSARRKPYEQPKATEALPFCSPLLFTGRLAQLLASGGHKPSRS
jgi:hypothetical protein